MTVTRLPFSLRRLDAWSPWQADWGNRVLTMALRSSPWQRQWRCKLEARGQPTAQDVKHEPNVVTEASLMWVLHASILKLHEVDEW